MGTEVLVTGGSGFIGGHVVEALLAAGDEVRCVVKPTSPFQWLRDANVRIVRGTLADPSVCERAVAGVTTVYHLAGLGAARLHEDPAINVVGTQRLLQACIASGSTVRTFVFLSSIKASRPAIGLEPVTEACPSAPVDAYGRSKHEAETMLRLAPEEIRTVIVRAPIVYGPRDRTLLPLFRIVSRGWLPVMRRDLGPRFSLVYVKDLVACLLELVKQTGARADTLFVAQDHACSWNEFMWLVARNQRGTPRQIVLPFGAVKVVCRILAGALAPLGAASAARAQRFKDLVEHSWICSASRARDRYGLICETSLDDGIRQTESWYESAGWL